MRIGERYGRGFSASDDRVDELTPQDMILDSGHLGDVDDESGVPTVRRGRTPQNATPAARSHGSLIPPPSRVGGDDALDFASILREPVPMMPYRSIDFDETPMPTSVNTTSSVAPVAMPLDDDDWIEEQLRHAPQARARWPYAIGAVAALGIGLVALSGWNPSWNQPSNLVARPSLAAMVPPRAIPAYRAEDLPVAQESDDPEVVYRENQAQLEQEARAAAVERDRQEAREARERRSEQPAEEKAVAVEQPASVDDSPPAEKAAAGEADTAAQPAEQPAEQPPPFDRDAAATALTASAGAASSCRAEGVPGGQVVRVAVTFAPSGRVNSAQITEGTLLGTSTGSCVARAFYSARVNPFTGPTVTVHKTVRVE